MKIATFNIWNSSRGMPQRGEQIIAAILSTDADIIGLQEVTNGFKDVLFEKTSYPYHAFSRYPGSDHGLAFLSKAEILRHTPLNDGVALHGIFAAGDLKLSVTNLHLPWQSANAREKQIVEIDSFIGGQSGTVDYSLMFGDFACGVISGVHRFLIGEQSINGTDAANYWYDMAAAFQAMTGTVLRPTLDFGTNPRWKGENVWEAPVAIDRMMFSASGSRVLPALKNVSVFGTEISAITELSPSDHYGMMAEIDFEP